MFRRFAKALTLLAAFAVMFALVCPLAPTPTAVAKVKPANSAMPAIVTVLPAVMILFVARALVVSPEAQHPTDVLSLTCVRTC